MSCSKCNDRGYLIDDQGAASTCVCQVLRGWLTSVRATPGLSDIERLGSGFLGPKEDGSQPLGGSSFVRSKWLPLLEHLGGWVFGHLRTGLEKPKVMIVSTAELRALYFGEDGGVHHQGSKLAASLRGYDLVVVRVLSTKTNKLISDVLVECVALARTIWVVYPPTYRSFQEHPFWNTDLEEVCEGFHDIDLGPTPDNVTPFDRLGFGGLK